MGERGALGGGQKTRKASPQKQLWRDIGIHMHDSVKLVGKVVIINGQAVSRTREERGGGEERGYKRTSAATKPPLIEL